MPGTERTSGTASGVIRGVSAGSSFGPWGMVIGGVVGGALGLFGSSKKRKARRARKRAQRQLFEMQRELREESLDDQERLTEMAFGLQMAGLERQTASQIARLDLSQTGEAQSSFASSAQAATRNTFEEQRSLMIEQNQAQHRAIQRDRAAIEIDRVAMEAGIKVDKLETKAQATAQLINTAFSVGSSFIGNMGSTTKEE